MYSEGELHLDDRTALVDARQFLFQTTDTQLEEA